MWNIKAMATKLSLLHRGRTCRLPPTDQSTGRSFPCTYRNETNWRPSRSRTHWRYRTLRTWIVLRYLDDKFCICIYQCGTLSRYFSESPKVSRTMCQAEMLPKLWGRRLCRVPKRLPSKEMTLETTDSTFYFSKRIFWRELSCTLLTKTS